MPLENLSSNEDQPSHIESDVAEARAAIGSFEKDVRQTDEVWDEQGIESRINDRLSRHEDLPVIEIYDFNADTMRRQSLRLFAQADAEKRELTEDEEREVVAAQLRLTLMESLAGALDAYMDIMEQYDSFKKIGLRADPDQERIVFQHLGMVKDVAKRRSDIAFKLHTKQLTSDNGQIQALKADNDMLKLLAAEDPDVPGANPDGILPVYSLMISMLNTDYNETLRRYEQAADDDFDDIRNRSERADGALRKAFPHKREGEITEDEAAEVLEAIEKGYTLQDYLNDRLVLTKTSSSFDVLKERGKKNIQRLASMNAVMGSYQIFRAELSSIRHHFDQGYDLNTKKKPLPGETSDAAMDATRGFLENQQEGSISALQRHLTVVKEGVLNVGILEKGETLYNERGRPLITRLADKIAALETSWIPDAPFTKEGFVRNSTREYLMSGLYDALGWPRDADGRPKEWKKLSDSEKEEIREMQDSIEKSIDRFNESGSFEKVQTSVNAARALIERKDLHAENFVSAEEIDESTLPTEIVTDKNIDELVKKYGAPVVYKMCFVQLQQNWDGYSERYAKLLEDFHETIGVHYDFSRMMKDFADKQAGIAQLLAGLGIAGWIALAIAGVTGYEAARFLMKKSGGVAFRLAKGGTRMAFRATKGAARLAGHGIAEGAKRIRMPRPPGAGVGAAEKSLETAAKGSKIGRVLGPLGIVLSAVQLREVMDRDTRLKELPEFEGVEAAVELMEAKGNKKASRYKKELEYLRNKQDAIVMKRGCESLRTALEKRFPSGTGNDNDIAENLKSRCLDLEQYARNHVSDFHQLFPITDYLMTDPKKEKGNVGFDVRNLDDARERGMAFENHKHLQNFGGLNALLGKEEKSLKGKDRPKPLEEKGPLPEKIDLEQLLKEAQAEAVEKEGPASFEGMRHHYERLLEEAAELLDQ